MNLLVIASRIVNRCPKCDEITLLDENDRMVCDSCGWKEGSGKSIKKPSDSVIQKIIKRNAESFGLSFVPNVVKDIMKEFRIRPDEAKKMLLRESELGSIELRPESGLGRLSKTEINLCIETPNGVLSWVITR